MKRKTIIVPIKKEFVDAIREGRKRIEYRSTLPSPLRIGERMTALIYETKSSGGAGAIVGEVTLGPFELIYDPEFKIDKIPEETTPGERHYIIRTNGVYAIHLTAPRFYKTPRALSEYGIKKPPQSWTYPKQGGG